jgi:hypothetical protein
MKASHRQYRAVDGTMQNRFVSTGCEAYSTQINNALSRVLRATGRLRAVIPTVNRQSVLSTMPSHALTEPVNTCN